MKSDPDVDGIVNEGSIHIKTDPFIFIHKIKGLSMILVLKNDFPCCLKWTLILPTPPFSEKENAPQQNNN